jgi:hypothetical protein
MNINFDAVRLEALKMLGCAGKGTKLNAKAEFSDPDGVTDVNHEVCIGGDQYDLSSELLVL